MGLSSAERDFLSLVARDAVEAALAGRAPAVDLPVEGPLTVPSSVFVTLRRKGRLRGCIGLIGERYPLAECVRESARRALEDPRFDPVTARELPDLALEISVLTPFREIETADEIVVGRHGLYLIRGHAGGLLLPQVPEEQGWSRDEFLAGICRKSGLPADAWRSPETKLHVFEAEVF